jgi:hypothetical protein
MIQISITLSQETRTAVLIKKKAHQGPGDSHSAKAMLWRRWHPLCRHVIGAFGDGVMWCLGTK